MQVLSFSAIVSGMIDAISFENLDRPFNGQRPLDRWWGVPPAQMADWFCHERGPQAAGIIAIAQAHIFGSTLVYRERGDSQEILELEQNFLSVDTATAGLAQMEKQRAAGILRVRDIEGEVVILSGFPYQLYGHWMVDFMPRLQMLRVSGRRLSNLRFLLPSDLPDFALEWLALAGVKPDQIIPYDPDSDLCQCEHVLIPTNLRSGGRALPSMAQAALWMTQIACSEPVSPTRSLYISRESWGNITRKLENYEEVEGIMGDHGFEIVYPEKLSIAGQAELFASAKIIAGDYGSGLHNTIFSYPMTPVIALRGTELHPGFLQSGLCEIRSQPLSYIFGRTWTDDRSFQHYEIGANDLHRCLQAAAA